VGHWHAAVGLTAITLAIAALSLGAVRLLGSLTLARLLVAAWPPLMALATLGFAWRVTAFLLEVENLLLEIAGSPTDKQLIRSWRRHFTIRRQVSVASVIAIVGASITGWILMRSGVQPVAASMFTFAIFISAFLGGLGFYVGAWSPSLSSSASRCRLKLDPFSPGDSEELKAVASLYGRIVFSGVLVGIVLCGPLLQIALHYAVLRNRLWVFSIVFFAWLAVGWVFGVVHYHLHVSIMKTRRATRLTLRGLIEKAYDAITPASEEGRLKALRALIDLDEMVRASRSFALNFLLVLQVLASAATAAAPLLFELAKKKLGIGGGP
jgi:hypothetical protein